MIIIHITSPGSKQGKTTTAVKVIKRLAEKGYRVCAVKHAHHNLDTRGKDTDRMHEAGAFMTLGVSEGEFLVRARDPHAIAPILWKALAEQCEYVVIEGFKKTIPPELRGRALLVLWLEVAGNKIVETRVETTGTGGDPEKASALASQLISELSGLTGARGAGPG